MAKYFLSHASNHKGFCESVQERLEALGHEVWLDAFDLHHGASIPQSICDGIYDCDYFVLVLSPEILTSTWVQWEINVATNREIVERRENFILPVMRNTVSLPKLIAHKRYIAATADIDQVTTDLANVNTHGPALHSVQGYHTIFAEISSSYAGTIGLRRVVEGFYATFLDPQTRYSYFPCAASTTPHIVKNGRAVISCPETPNTPNTENRETIVELHENGRIAIYETGLDQHDGAAVFWVGRLISKLARVLAKGNSYYHNLGVTNNFDLRVSLFGLSNGFCFERLAPGDCEPPMSMVLGGTHTIGNGVNLSASVRCPIDPNGLAETIVRDRVSELQADLFFPIQMRGLFGQPNRSLRMNINAVERLTHKILTRDELE